VTLVSDDYYSPDAVDRWLRQWDLLCSLAETPATSRHHLDSDHHKDGPCLDSIRSGSGGRIPDTLSWADVRADLQRAYAQLAIGSIERQVIWERMHRPANLDVIARRMGSRYSVVLESYHRAVERMSATLGHVSGAAPAIGIGFGLSVLLTGTRIP
jgi:hypothetical protein